MVESRADMEGLSPAPVEGRLPRLWGRRGFWQTKLRWAVAPVMFAGLLAGWALGFEVAVMPIVLIAVTSLVYNAIFAWLCTHRVSRLAQRTPQRRRLERLVTLLQVLIDYAAMFLLIYFTGGVSSPLAVFLIFHVIIAAIQFSAAVAFRLAGLAAGGLWLMFVAQLQGWIVLPSFSFKGLPIGLLNRPVYAAVMLFFFSATLFITVAIITRIMQRLRERVAERTRAYAAIEDLLRERSQSMLEVAHNLRAPLGAGLSMLDLLSGGYLGEVTPRQAEHLSRIVERLKSLDQTIGELLTIARARDRSRQIPDVVVDLNQLATQTERTFRQEAAAKQLTFTVQADDTLPELASGANLLQQVMENLVSNAIKYTPAGGTVNVRFRLTESGNVRIVVEDTGIGIPAGEQEKLFREFFRASNAKRESPTGTGLGLALVKRAVERHGGRIQLHSVEGRGTTVVVDLPTDPPATQQPVKSAAR